MNKYFRVIVIVISICWSVSSLAQNKDLTNSKWVFNFGKCQDYIKFKKQNQYEFFSCETGDTVFGFYKLNGNSLILKQVKGVYDKEFPIKSQHRTPQIKFRLIINNDSMWFIERWELNMNNKWIKSDFTFSKNYLFKKDK